MAIPGTASPRTSLRAFPAAWLRDNCDCPQCRDSRNGQKLFQITDLPDRLAIGSERMVERDGGTVWEVRWRPDGHVSRYARDWLDAAGDADDRTEDAKELWAADHFGDGQLPEAHWEDYQRDDAERLRVLDAVARLGFALVREVPVHDGQVLAVARMFGFVRETNYGRLFEVRVEDSPNNLAFTSAAIAPHTDNP
jgi:hypothetical protein